MSAEQLEKIVNDLGIKIANLVIELSLKNVQISELNERIDELESKLYMLTTNVQE